MIKLSHVTKRYRTQNGIHTVFSDVNFCLEKGMNIGILGLNGAGKSTLIRLISGAELPNEGAITRTSTVSWPVGFSGCFSGSLTGRENLRFVCRIYGADITAVTSYVENFAELNEFLDMPVKTYSSGMRARLAFGLSMALGFDFYLIDEALSVGDAVFRKKADDAFKERMSHSSMVIVSHSLGTIKRYCTCSAVLHQGQFSYFDNVDDGLKRYREICNEVSANHTNIRQDAVGTSKTAGIRQIP